MRPGQSSQPYKLTTTWRRKEAYTFPSVTHPSVLLVAGLDPSGGAGLLADARVVDRHGLHAVGVATALTEQDSTGCASMHPVAPELVAKQLARLVEDFEVRAIKVGMLGTGALAQAVAHALRRVVDAGVPIVVDPVLRASRGASLFEGTPQELAPVLALATVITPNLDELAALTGHDVATADEMRAAARLLKARGPRAVLAKGGHLDGDPVDVLVDDDGALSLPGARVEGPTPHGTGCGLSADLACRLALGAPLREAVTAAKAHLRDRIAAARAVGRGRPFLG